MTERWSRVSEILYGALELEAGQLEAHLASACEGDAELEAEVRSLLDHYRRSTGFFESSGSPLMARAPGIAPATPQAGAVLGAWRLVRPIGEGGMGTVWLVERIEGQFTQLGALKLIKLGLASEEMIRRFRRERQILASLDHPHIARLMDGGATPEGLPYLVMEYIEGEPLYAYCSGRSLSLAGRLRLFIALCAAVQYAHQKLVVHRDLKPGNVMVTRDGAPKLLDFGVAKMFDVERIDATGEVHTLALPFTPLYASPEQLRGEEATAASDLYSLGVLLYELLTGQHPYPIRSAVASDVIRAVLGTDPIRPSTAVTHVPQSTAAADSASGRLPAPPHPDAGVLRRRLAGDLDNIVLKAMSKDPARRYPSVERVAADIEYYLEARPVQARPDSWSYRASKFTKRNRVAVAAGALGLAALIAGLGISLWQAAEARRQRAVAEERFRDLRGLANTLIFDVHDAVAKLPGATAVRELVLSRGVHYLDRLSSQAGRDTALQRELADAWERIGTVQGAGFESNVGKTDEAMRSFGRSLALREALIERRPNDAATLEGLGGLLSRMALTEIVHGQTREGLGNARRALFCRERLSRLDPGSSADREELLKSQFNLGQFLMMADSQAAAVPLMGRSVSEYGSWADAGPGQRNLRRAWAREASSYGGWLVGLPAMADSAAHLLDRCATFYAAEVRRDPADRDALSRLALAHDRLGSVEMWQRGRADRALPHASACREIYERLAPADSADVDLQHLLADSRASEGVIAAVAGLSDRAERLLALSIPRYESWVRRDSSDLASRESLLLIWAGRGFCEVSRARAAASTARAHWAAAHEWFDKASRERAWLASHGDPVAGVPGLLALMGRERAACDSALALSAAAP